MDIDATADEAEWLSGMIREWLTDQKVVDDANRGFIKFVTGRQVVTAMENGIELTCSVCHADFEPDQDAWGSACQAWFDGDDRATFACPICGNVESLRDWRGPCQWGFGYVSIEFWNWPPLSDAFVRAVSERLRHRTVLVRAHV